MADPVDAHALMATLRAQLDLLNAVLEECVTSAVVYDVPLPDVITPKQVRGREAIKRATQAFRNMSRSNDQSPGSVWRVPGIICVDKDLSKVVDNINRVKSELKSYIKDAHPSPRARNTFHRTEFPGRVMLQVYRKIYLNNEPVNKIRFSWAPYTYSTQTLSRQEALDMLIKRSISGHDHSDNDRFTALQMAIDYVRSNNKNSQYAIRKPRSPYPVATIHQVGNAGLTKKSLQMSLPLIIGPVSTGSEVDIGELPVYNKSNRRKTRSDKQPVELLYKPLYLYQKLV